MKKALTLLASLAIALGPTLAMHQTWMDFTTPAGIAETVTISGGVIMAWLSESPRLSKKV